MLLALILLLKCFSSFADTNLGFSLNTSKMDLAPVDNSSLDEQTFKKTSMSFFSKSSFLDESIIFTAKTEVLNLTREPYSVNKTNFPQAANQGIRSADFDIMYHFYTERGWKLYAKGIYNTKGYESNNDIHFALNNPEYGGGIVATRSTIKHYGLLKVIQPVIQSMLGVSGKPFFQVEANFYANKMYAIKEGSFLYTRPIRRNVIAKVLGKSKKYTFDDSATRRFRDERKMMIGIILKSPSQHAIDFSFYYDSIIKEKGLSIGYYYYFKHNKENAVSQALINLERKYVPKKEINDKSHTVEDKTRTVVKEILQEEGLI